MPVNTSITPQNHRTTTLTTLNIDIPAYGYPESFLIIQAVAKWLNRAIENRKCVDALNVIA